MRNSQKYDEDTLFYIYYNIIDEGWQLYAAEELYI
jgi:CCR4-NOT transcriptional regulation complex NOT5 subunit